MEPTAQNCQIETESDANSLYELMQENLTDSSFKGSVVTRNSFVLVKTIETKQKYRWKFLDEKIVGFFQGIMFVKYHFLFTSVNEKIKQLTSGGFIEHWIQRWAKHRYIVEKPPLPDLKVLSLDDLGIEFQIWLLVLGAAFVAFICELLYYWLPKIWHLCIFHFVLQRYFKLREKATRC